MPQKEISTARIVIQPIAIGIALALAVRFLALDAFSIPSASMSPTLDVGDHILVTPYEIPLISGEPERGDVVVFRGNPDEFLVKRIVALPGEEIEIGDGRVRINGHALPEPYLPGSRTTSGILIERLPVDGYFVMGDARDNSLDSRSWGPVPRSAFVGKARLIFWSSNSIDSAKAASAKTSATAPVVRSGKVRWDRILRLIE